MRFSLLLALAAFATAVETPAATVDGAKIHWSDAGSGAKTMIFVHGWTCNESTWDSQVPVIAKQYRVITLDLPGHGQSGTPAGGKLSMDLFARSVEAVRAEAGVDHVILVGHSMGTPVIIQYVRLFPKHAAALVFVDGLVTFGSSRPTIADMPWLSGPDSLKGREKMVASMYSPSTTPELKKKISEMMLAAPPATALAAMEAMLDPAIWKDDPVTLPILGLYADKSRLGDRAYMKDHFPNLEYTEIPGTGHFLMLEKPQQFNTLLLAFAAKQIP